MRNLYLFYHFHFNNQNLNISGSLTLEAMEKAHRPCAQDSAECLTMSKEFVGTSKKWKILQNCGDIWKIGQHHICHLNLDTACGNSRPPIHTEHCERKHNCFHKVASIGHFYSPLFVTLFLTCKINNTKFD